MGLAVVFRALGQVASVNDDVHDGTCDDFVAFLLVELRIVRNLLHRVGYDFDAILVASDSDKVGDLAENLRRHALDVQYVGGILVRLDLVAGAVDPFLDGRRYSRRNALKSGQHARSGGVDVDLAAGLAGRQESIVKPGSAGSFLPSQVVRNDLQTYAALRRNVSSVNKSAVNTVILVDLQTLRLAAHKVRIVACDAHLVIRQRQPVIFAFGEVIGVNFYRGVVIFFQEFRSLDRVVEAEDVKPVVALQKSFVLPFPDAFVAFLVGVVHGCCIARPDADHVAFL